METPGSTQTRSATKAQQALNEERRKRMKMAGGEKLFVEHKKRGAGLVDTFVNYKGVEQYLKTIRVWVQTLDTGHHHMNTPGMEFPSLIDMGEKLGIDTTGLMKNELCFHIAHERMVQVNDKHLRTQNIESEALPDSSDEES